MATINNSNWEYEKPVEGDSQATAPNGAKVQPVILDGSLSEGNTGNGNIGYDTSRIDTTDVNTKLQSIVFTEPDGSTTKPYEVENPEDLGSTNEVVVWIYDSAWATDDTVAFNFYVGGGDGTDYSYSTDPNVTGDTGANPWGETGINAETVQHLQEEIADETTGNTVIDSSPNGNDGTVTGVNVGVSGQFDGAGTFDGTDDEIKVGSYGVFDGSYMFSAWIKTSSTDGSEAFFAGGGGTGEATYQFRTGRADQGDEGVLEFRFFDGSNAYSLVGSTTINDGNWHYAVGMLDTSDDEMRVYVDGSLDNTLTNITTTPRLDGNTDNWIGSNNGFNYWTGDIDEAKVFDGTVSANQIQAHYDASPKGGQIFFNAQSGSPIVVTQSLSETIGFNEVRNEQQELFRNILEVLNFTDKDVKKVLKKLETETLNTSGTLSKTVFKQVRETLGFNEQVSTNFGVLTGTVTLSGNPVQNAYVYAFEKSSEEFAGFDKTDSNGDYEIRSLNDNTVYLVAVDYDDSGTLYGDEKSVDLNDPNN